MLASAYFVFAVIVQSAFAAGSPAEKNKVPEAGAPKAVSVPAQAAPAKAPAWNGWEFLLGDWVAESTLEEGKGEFSFELKTNYSRREVLLRRNHAEYPPQNGKPASVHDDLMVLEPAAGGADPAAVFVDSEGNIIRYTARVAEAGKAAVFTSAPAAGQPAFRLTYKLTEKGGLEGIFEIQPPGAPNFFPYKKWVSHKK